MNKSVGRIKENIKYKSRFHEDNNTRYIETLDPNACMNDYTKNISQSIFTPGVHPMPKTELIKSVFNKSKNNNQSKPGKLYSTNFKGEDLVVTGTLGQKKQHYFRTAKKSDNKHNVFSYSTGKLQTLGKNNFTSL